MQSPFLEWLSNLYHEDPASGICVIIYLIAIAFYIICNPTSGPNDKFLKKQQYKFSHPPIPKKMRFKIRPDICFGYDKKTKSYVGANIKDSNNNSSLIFGGSGSGKTKGIIIPNILMNIKNGVSFLTLDLKMDIYKATVNPKNKSIMKNVIVINPHDPNTYAFDCLYRIRGKNKNDYALIKSTFTDIARCLISVSGSDPHWGISSRSLFVTLCMIYYLENPDEATLPSIIEKIRSEKISEKINTTFEQTDIPLLKQLAAAHYKVNDDTFSSLVSNLNESLDAFLGNPAISIIMGNGKKRFNPTFLNKKRPCYVYLCINNDELEELAPCLNTMFTLTIQELNRRPEGSRPVEIILDEYGRLLSAQKQQGGKSIIAVLIRDLASTGRSRNITCICCTQSYSSLFDGYDDNELNSLIANFSFVAALDVKDSDGRDFFKKICGKKNFKIYNWNSKSSGGYSKSVRYEQRDVVDEFFLQTLHNRLECILINSYSGFAIFNRCAYFEDPDKRMAQIVAENEKLNK